MSAPLSANLGGCRLRANPPSSPARRCRSSRSCSRCSSATLLALSSANSALLPGHPVSAAANTTTQASSVILLIDAGIGFGPPGQGTCSTRPVWQPATPGVRAGGFSIPQHYRFMDAASPWRRLRAVASHRCAGPRFTKSAADSHTDRMRDCTIGRCLIPPNIEGIQPRKPAQLRCLCARKESGKGGALGRGRRSEIGNDFSPPQLWAVRKLPGGTGRGPALRVYEHPLVAPQLGHL